LTDVYSDLLSAYYQEVGAQLDTIQSDNFIAFSQHHGLKTNLIDFTSAPLVALYFACDRKAYDTSKGYVYVLNEEDTVNASQFLVNHSIKGISCHDIFNRFTKSDCDIVAQFRHLVEQYAGYLSAKSSLDLLVDIMKLIRMHPELERSNSYLTSRESLFKNGNDVVDAVCQIPNLVQQFIPDFDIFGDMNIMEYTALLQMFFSDLRLSYLNGLSHNIVFPKIPYLMYKTPLKFDRIRNQSAIFLYQAFFDYQTGLDDMGGLMVQEIIPSFIIEVNNQKEIMNELDFAGINRKFIFGDFDNTAQYVNETLLGKYL
jgi:hypothetical protein